MNQQRAKHLSTGEHGSASTLAPNRPSRINPLRLAVEITLGLFWIVFLQDTTAIYDCYIVVFAFAAFNVVRVQRVRLDDRLTLKRKIVLRLLSGFLSCLVTIANYAIIYGSAKGSFERLSYAILLLCGGYVVWDIITSCAYIDSYRLDEWVRQHQIVRPLRGYQVFAIVFVFLSAIYLSYLFLVAYPGNLSPDSFNQLRQIMSGSYNNHHPYYSTQLIRLFFTLGMKIFGEVSAAIATFSVVQCLAVSAVYAFTVETLFEAKCPRVFLIILTLSFGVIPYQFMYSVVMWKDIPFSMGCLLLLVTLWRSAGAFTHPKINLVLMFFSTVFTVVMRNNGIYAFLVFLLVGALFLIRRHAFRRFITVVGVVLIGFALSVVMKYPLLRALGVPETEGIMNLAIPIQQIARIVVDDVDISDEDRVLIEAVAPAYKIKKKYNPNHFRGMKRLVLREGFDSVRKNKNAYVTLWLRLGLEHPLTYLKAWADQTAHYWNAGYDFQYGGFAIYGNKITENDLGIESSPRIEGLASFAEAMSMSLRDAPLLRMLLCVGLHTWFLLILFVVNILRGKGEWLLVVLPLAIILTLAIASPVLSNFRYAYAVITTLGFVTAASFVPKQNVKEG